MAPASWRLFLKVVQEDGSACWGLLMLVTLAFGGVKLSWSQEGMLEQAGASAEMMVVPGAQCSQA